MIEPLSYPRSTRELWLLRALAVCLIVSSAYLAVLTAGALLDVFAERIKEHAPAPKPTALPPAEATLTPTPTLTEQATLAAGDDPISLPERLSTVFAGDTPTPTLTPTPTPTPERGTIRKGAVDGQKMVYIPAGSFKMGNPPRNGEITSNNQPQHKVFVSDFWMGRVPVTNAMYARCVEAGGCTKPIREEINPHYYDPDFAKHPAVYVVWDQASAYCTWAGGRLPTEAEWERVARGGRDGGSYSWGQDPNPDIANLDNYRETTVAVGSFPENASPFGVLDMGSNVREWVNDWYIGNYYQHSPKADPQGPEEGKKKVLRGAAWHDPADYAVVTKRYSHEPDSAGANRGFRCAFD